MNVELPEAVVDELVELVAARVLERLGGPEPSPSPYMTTADAATFLACSRQRVHDLLSSRQLRRFKESGRTLVLREEVKQLVVERRD